jgi:hypothetical protein
MMRPLSFAAILPFAVLAPPAAAQEVFAGAYAHAVDTPLTLYTGEGGADFELGFRFAPQDALKFLGKPAPYVLASVNSQGDTSFAGGGLSWKFGKGPLFVRPGIGLIVHTGPRLCVGPNLKRTDLGSPVLFVP